MPQTVTRRRRAGKRSDRYLTDSMKRPCARACLKNHSRHLHALLCGIFVPNSLNAAHCAAFIWPKSPTKWNAHLAESIFQTRSKLEKTSLSAGGFLRVPYGYRSWRRLRYQRAGNPFHPSESPVIRLSGIDGQEYSLPELQIISIIVLYILFYNDSMNI